MRPPHERKGRARVDAARISGPNRSDRRDERGYQDAPQDEAGANTSEWEGAVRPFHRAGARLLQAAFLRIARAMPRFWIAAFGALLAACSKPASSDAPVAPAPKASAAQASFTFQTGTACPDLGLCERECDAGQADRCRRLGDAYQFATDGGKDDARATSYYELACKLKNAPACMSAGQMYEYHHGVAENDAKAADYYRQGCDSGHVPSCANYAVMLENGRGVPKDVPAALRLYGPACRAGAGYACQRAAALAGERGLRGRQERNHDD